MIDYKPLAYDACIIKKGGVDAIFCKILEWWITNKNAYDACMQ